MNTYALLNGCVKEEDTGIVEHGHVCGIYIYTYIYTYGCLLAAYMHATLFRMKRKQ